VKGKNLQGSNVKGTNKPLAFLMWIYMGQIAWKRGHRSPHRRGGPTSVMPTGQNLFYIVMQFHEMKEFKSVSIDQRWLCLRNRKKNFLVILN
jgi:hypothetical protein